MSKPPYAEDRTYGGVRGSGETIVSHSLLDYTFTMLFTEETKKLIISYVIAIIIPIAFIVPMYFCTTFGLSNEFLMVAVCYLGFVGLYLVTRAGTFDIFRYQFINWFSSFGRKNKLRYNDVSEYKLKLSEKRHMARQMWHPFAIVGTICLILCIIFAFFPI